VLLGAAWSAYNLTNNQRAVTLAADGIACARQADEPQLEVWGRNLLAGLAWLTGDADRIVAEVEASRALFPRPTRRSRRGPRSCWPTPPSWPATWPSRSGITGSRSSSPGPQRTRKGSLSR
jgi:hypothetical protein